MAMDPAKAAKAFQAYLDNAEKSSGKTIADMHKALKASGLDNHTEQRAYLMNTFGIGHGHAQAVLTKYKNPDFNGSSGEAKPSARKAPANKAVTKKPAAKK